MADLKISQLPTFTPPLQATDLFPASQFIGTPGAQTNKVPWGSILSQIQSSSFASLTVSGLTGATSGTRYVGATASGSPVSGTFIAGDFIIDKTGAIWVCTVDGAPGTWASVSGPSVNQWVASGNYLRPSAIGTINGIQIFPLTASTGSLKFLSTSNSGDTDTVITNASMGQATTITLKDPGVVSSSFILADSPENQSITSTGTAPGVSFIGQHDWNVYGQIEARDIADQNYHITYGVSSVNNGASIFAGNAGVGYIPLYLGSPGGSFVGIGSNGFKSGFKVFPSGVNSGTLQLSATNSPGNFDAIISNAIFGQTSTINIPDPGVSSTSFILANNPSAQTINTTLLISGGNLLVTSGTIIASSDITAGLPGGGSAGMFKSFPSAANTGYLGLKAIASSGNFNTTISNASMGQSTIVSIPDPGASTANFILSSATAAQSIASNVDITGRITATSGLFGISPNIYTGTQIDNLFVMNPLNPAEQLNVGYDATNDRGFIQSIHQGVAPTALMLQSFGGAVGIGLPNNHVFSQGFEVGSTSKFLSIIFADDGINVSDAGGGIQFNDTGNMSIDTGISFFSGSQYYRIGFESLTGSRGWIRQNVDVADGIHGFAWSAGPVPNSNYVMVLDGLGRLALSSAAQSASMQSLANIYGDIFLGNISTPANPTAGGKLYSKLISGDSNLMYLDSAGTEHQLTNGTAIGYWDRTGTQLSTSTAGDSVSLTNFIQLGQISTPATPTSASRIYTKSDGNVYALGPTSTGLEKPLTSINKRVSTTVDSNGPSDDLVCLDSTSGANLFVVDASLIRRPLMISWTAGASIPSFQAAAGQTINGSAAAITIGTLYNSVVIVPIAGSSTASVIISTAP